MNVFNNTPKKKISQPILAVCGPDPLKVLASTKTIVENARFAVIDVSKIETVAGLIKKKLESGLAEPETSFGITGSYEKDVQLIFLENAVNFSFWPDYGRPKWQVSVSGGWYSLVNCFVRAIKDGQPILDASYLAHLTIPAGRQIFKGDDGGEIPMLKARVINLREAGRVLNQRYDGQFANVLSEAEYDAVSIAKLLRRNLKSFRDSSVHKDSEVIFHKRAQICAFDLAAAVYKHCGKKLSRLDQLTAFADYRLPQILRAEGLIVYSPSLERTVDHSKLIASGSLRELEIRSATVWAVELLRQELKIYSAGEIDNALWLLSQGREDMKPYHRTRTICY